MHTSVCIRVSVVCVPEVCVFEEEDSILQVSRLHVVQSAVYNVFVWCLMWLCLPTRGSVPADSTLRSCGESSQHVCVAELKIARSCDEDSARLPA